MVHKSDHQAEISGNIVRYSALAPRLEVLLFWYLVCARAVSLGMNFSPYAWEKISAQGELNTTHLVVSGSSTCGLDFQFIDENMFEMWAVLGHFFKLLCNCLSCHTYSTLMIFSCFLFVLQSHDFPLSLCMFLPKGLSRVRDGLLVAEMDLNLCRQVKDKWCFQVCIADKFPLQLSVDGCSN